MRPLVHVERRADLLHLARIQDDDSVTHRHGFDLIVGHVDGRDLQAVLQLLDLGAHLHPQLGVEVGERLVEEEHRRVADDGAPERDALPLSARQFFRTAREQFVEPEDLRSIRDHPVDLGPRRLAQDQAELEIFAHAHVRIERVALEDHRDVAVLGRDVVHHLAADRDRAAGDLLEAGHHA